MNRANFLVDTSKCVGCRKCVRVCPGGILSLNQEKQVQIANFKKFGWNGCWKCEHCLAVCPMGAISIFGHKPENSLPSVDYETAAPAMDALIANRHSCRRYQDKNVDASIISNMLNLLSNAPNGGNKQQVEYTLIERSLYNVLCLYDNKKRYIEINYHKGIADTFPTEDNICRIIKSLEGRGIKKINLEKDVLNNEQSNSATEKSNKEI